LAKNWRDPTQHQLLIINLAAVRTGMLMPVLRQALTLYAILLISKIKLNSQANLIDKHRKFEMTNKYKALISET